MNVVFLERPTRTSSAGSRFLVITLIEIQGIQIVSQPKHFSPQPIHPEKNEYGFDYPMDCQITHKIIFFLALHLFPALRAFWFLKKNALGKNPINRTVLVIQLERRIPPLAFT